MFLLWCQQDLTAVFWNHDWLPPRLPQPVPSLRFQACPFRAALSSWLSSCTPECYPRGGCSTAGFLPAATICCCWLQVPCPAPAPRQPARTLCSAYANRQAGAERVWTRRAAPLSEPRPRLCILNPICAFNQMYISPNVHGPQLPGGHSRQGSLPEPL